MAHRVYSPVVGQCSHRWPFFCCSPLSLSFPLFFWGCTRAHPHSLLISIHFKKFQFFFPSTLFIYLQYVGVCVFVEREYPSKEKHNV